MESKIEKMVVNLIYLYNLCQNKEELVAKLQEWNLIPKEGEYKCTNCNGLLKLTKDSDRVDGYRWICYGKIKKYEKAKMLKCGMRYELRGTFFERSKLSMFEILGFAHLWCENVGFNFISKQLGINKSTCVDWASFCREVVFNAMIDNRVPIGGVGKVVEIDESKFGKRKYHRGHYVEGQWVFGGYKRGTGRVFMVPVENLGADTLVPIIKEWILPGTEIISDFWKAYDCLNLESYEHLKVNHSINFKDPETGAHTNAIESSWRATKATFSPSGRRKSTIPGNLARYMFFKKCKETNDDRTVEFFKYAGKLYPGTETTTDCMNADYDVSDISDVDEM